MPNIGGAKLLFQLLVSSIYIVLEQNRCGSKYLGAIASCRPPPMVHHCSCSSKTLDFEEDVAGRPRDIVRPRAQIRALSRLKRYGIEIADARNEKWSKNLAH